MPLPEGLSELTFAGVLAGHRLPMITRGHSPAIYADADFVIEGTISPGGTKPEGPFGDHLGYYARRHDFPVMRVEHVWHRDGAIWPMTVVGRPPADKTPPVSQTSMATAPQRHTPPPMPPGNVQRAMEPLLVSQRHGVCEPRDTADAACQHSGSVPAPQNRGKAGVF